MNLVKQIMDQLTGGAIDQLGSLLGTNAETTERAATAAVPSLLSALSGMMSSDDGARKVTNALNGLDTSGFGNIAQMLGGNSSSVLSTGTSLLSSLFGDSMTSGLASTLSRFTGLNSGIVKTLLAYLTPLVLGKVANQWKNQGGTSQALKSLFAEQRDNIANAVPAGFSLADISDANDIRKPVYATTHTRDREPVAARSPLSWLVPAALALLGGFVLWQFLSRPRPNEAVAEKVETAGDNVTAMKPVLPETIDVSNVASVRDGLGGIFKSLDTTFTDIRDAASAERAAPALRDLDAKIDAMNQMLSQLPESSRATLRPLIEEQVKVATEKAKAASSVEGVGAEIKAILQGIIAKITKWISAA
jgi:hypothetical protein